MKKYLEKGKEIRVYGQDISDFDRDDLVSVIGMLWNEIEYQRQSHQKTLDFMEVLRK